MVPCIQSTSGWTSAIIGIEAHVVLSVPHNEVQTLVRARGVSSEDGVITRSISCPLDVSHCRERMRRESQLWCFADGPRK